MIDEVEVGDRVVVVAAMLMIVEVEVGEELAVLCVLVVETADCFRFSCFLFFARLF